MSASACDCRLLVYSTALMSVMGVASILPVLPAMARDLGIDAAHLGLLVYSFTLPGIILAPVGGILADKWGRKAVLVPCLMLFALGGLCASLCTQAISVLLWRMVQGCGAACLGVLYTTIVGDNYADDNERLVIMGRAATVLSLGAAIFPALGGILGEWGWRWALRLSVLALPVAFIAYMTPLPQPSAMGSMAHYARRMKGIILKRNTLFHFGLTLCAFCILYGPLVTYFPLMSHIFYEASPTHIGLLFAISSVGTAIATLFLGSLTRCFSQRRTVRAGIGFFACAMILLVFWQKEYAFWLLALPIACYGIGQGLTYPTVMSSLSSLAPPSGRGVLMAVNGTTLRLAQSVAPFLCGILFGVGSFTAVFTLGLIWVVVMYFFSRVFTTTVHA